MDFSEGAARATVAVCDWTGVFCLGFVTASTQYPNSGVPVVSAHGRCEIQGVVCLAFAELLINDADGCCAGAENRTCGLEGQELSRASTHSISHERWCSGDDCSGDDDGCADDDLRWVLPTPEPSTWTEECNRNQKMVRVSREHIHALQ